MTPVRYLRLASDRTGQHRSSSPLTKRARPAARPGAAVGRPYSSGIPALRSPAKKVASNRAWFFDTPKNPFRRRAMLE